jgi:hypothetical protein
MPPFHIEAGQVTLDLGKWFSSSFQLPLLYQPQFKKEYKIVKTLQSLSGFGWDDLKKMVTAEPQVWDSYLKVSVYYTVLNINRTDMVSRVIKRLSCSVKSLFHSMTRLVPSLGIAWLWASWCSLQSILLCPQSPWPHQLTT